MSTTNHVNTEPYSDKYEYLQGFNNHFQSEAVKDTLPNGQNAPQKCPKGLYAEQLSGSAFTAPRTKNFRSWLYRIRPSVDHKAFEKYEGNSRLESSFEKNGFPNQYRWNAPKIVSKEEKEVDFVDGLFTVAGNGNAASKSGFSIHMYTCNSDMKQRALCNSDGDFLIVPQEGVLNIQTEFGMILVKPLEICVIPRGVRFSVTLGVDEKKETKARGYVAEIFEGHFTIPDLGPIGANGLANPRDFCYPKASFVDEDYDFQLIQKYQGKLFVAKMDHSVFDVVAWHGNYAPYKYDLTRFNTMNTVSYDHPDPCIYTVITCQSVDYGTAVMDFAIFPPRWTVGENTFRPPYYHRNVMNEYMGLICGKYEAKEKGFVPGGSSLHNCMIPHGPEVKVFENASNAELSPQRIADGTMAFMFETSGFINPTDYALEHMEIDKEYNNCWNGFKKHFNSEKENQEK